VTAYTPQDDGFVEVLVMALPEDRKNVFVNTIVDFAVVIRNLTPDPIHNLTVIQELPANVDLVSVVGQDVTEAPFPAMEIVDNTSGKTLNFNYLNASSTNFTGNVDIELASDDFFVINYAVNITNTGAFEFERPTLTYYDYWGDEYSDIRGLDNTLNVKAKPDIEKAKFLPGFGTTETEYRTLIFLMLAVFAVAILSRMTYFKKPIEI
jgi:hypothetical protein